MDIMDIRQYAELMKEFNLTGLEITKDKETLRLERAQCAAPAATAISAAPAAAAPAAAAPAEAPALEPGTVQVTSPMVGVFYEAPAEGAKPYVQVGDTVKKGDVLCIIEAMKLMNEITSEYDGVIQRVCVGNRQVVDFGHPLFVIRRTDA